MGVPCTAAVGGDAGVNPRQDGRYGRDAAAAAGRLTKIGAGDAGFDFTKIANNGSALPASAALGSAPTDWACTRDNVTGLIWEVKTSSGLRGSAHTYTWYSADGTSNGGNVGSLGTDTCGATLSGAPYNNQCNTQNFTAAVNAVTLCGQRDWRLPLSNELLSIYDAGNPDPATSGNYFPNFKSHGTWSSLTAAFANGTFAWYVASGTSDVWPKDQNGLMVRLVRGGR